ncbi:polyhydroxyalkanoate depolymerase [Glaciecola petra]|uniref:Polyhydroxyalkanoate depolymerase n=1 Tax=Glaciecola petra TaxID=3075602 RepID=A0ABU2ZSJ3_9ALTE|nr:polyhydroxyalkanoate depolymerase [Aestuariibacter sp. P117]MDT0595608.1 polyhydroxyalkanoate depolymerase [Aestuariibacter sp. P117]
MNYQTYDYLARTGQMMNEGFSLVNDIVTHPSNPFSYTWTGRLASASLETAMRITRRYDKLGFNIDEVEVADGSGVYKVREEVTMAKPFCELVHFHALGHTEKNKVLLVAPLSGHHATLLKGTVEALLPSHEVYITDWADAREVPLDEGPFSFDCYVSYLIDFIEYLGEDTHVIAICQPTVQALIATAVMAEDNNSLTPKSLTLMAGPLDTTQNPTRVNEFAQKRPMGWFKNVAIMEVPTGYPGAGRKVYPGFMQLGGFISMNHKSHMKKHASFFQNLLFGEKEDAERFRAFYDEYMAVLDMPAEFYLETIERIFKNNEIANKTISYKGKTVDFSSIKNTALLTVEGANDDICGLGQTHAAQDICENIPADMRKHHIQAGAGHYGIFSGSMYRKNIRPIVTEFINKYA